MSPVPEVVHRLGVAVGAAALVWWAALGVARRRDERTLRRRMAALFALEAPTPPSPGRWRPAGKARIKQWGPPLGALAACWVLVGGVAGVLGGLAAAYGAWRWGRRRRARGNSAEELRAAAQELPLAADLLAACLAAGAGPREAAGAVGATLEGPVGARLGRAAAELRMGGEPADAWGRLGAIPGAAELARCLERAATSGSPAAGPVARVAERCRAERTRQASARARRAGVLITGPLGLCFLPAFLAAGVAPVVIGLAGGLLRR
ncbi:type II secretion system F family protein [Streptomyces sp. SDr-06]|uniref:type II secretion system F family protein n=1 Tax=Streptomyces sp. SDr-06 TaxID=2267702 RepID=UPI001CB8A889|nr:type II secretion system F family protein [Streptomyces sp. SDr-06]